MLGTEPGMDTKLKEYLGGDCWGPNLMSRAQKKAALLRLLCTAFTAAAAVLTRAQKLSGLKFHPKDPPGQSAGPIEPEQGRGATKGATWAGVLYPTLVFTQNYSQKDRAASNEFSEYPRGSNSDRIFRI